MNNDFTEVKKKYPKGFELFDKLISNEAFFKLMKEFDAVIKGDKVSPDKLDDMFERAELYANRLKK